MAGSRGGKKRGGSAKVSKTLSKQRFKNTGGLLGGVTRAGRGIASDVMMGVGLKEKDYKYEARTARNIRLSKERGGSDNDSPSRATPRPPTAAELRAQRKAAELAERKRLGQIARKKFEKEGGKRAAKKRALLLNIA